MSRESEVLEQSKINDNLTNDQKDVRSFINNFDEGILQAKSQLKKTTKTRKNNFIISLVFFSPIVANYLDLIKLNNIVEIILWLLSILVFIAALGSDPNKFQDELEKLEYKKNYFLQLFESNYKPTYFDSLVNINIDNLSEYYSLVKVHTNKSFILSCIASASGFLLIILGLIFQYINKDYENIAFLVTSSGIVVELVSGLFFYLYNKTVRQLKGYHDSLLEVQNILLSFKLIEETDQSTERLPLITKMIEFLVNRK